MKRFGIVLMLLAGSAATAQAQDPQGGPPSRGATLSPTFSA